MPQPKGVEPYSRYWTVAWRANVASHAITEGQLISRPRAAVFGTKAEADAFYAGLISAAAIAAGHPAPGTILQPLLEKFFNRKSFVTVFVNEHIESMYTSS